jgi:diguanylate cyclase (GGDEF)-like protein
MPARWSAVLAAVLVAAGAVAALASGPTPRALAEGWYWARIGAELLAAALLIARVGRSGPERLGWAMLAAGVLSWTVGDVVHGTGDPYLGARVPVAALLWLLCYAAVYAGLALLTRRLLLRSQAGVWLDGVILGLALAAVCAAMLIDGVLRAVDRTGAEVAVNLAYPVADVALVGLAAGAWAVSGWRPPPAWRLLLAGTVSMLIGDAAYFIAWGRHGYVYGQGAPFEAAWALAFLGFAVAAWRPPGRGDSVRPRVWGTTAVPAAVTVMATCLLALDHWTDSSTATVVLAATAMFVVAVRSILSVRELRQLVLSRREAMTDELTGLANRRALLRALETACGAEEPTGALLLCDLDGFKEFNDTLGHEAGDDLLRETAARIERAMEPDATVARLGGDEFAVLAHGAGRATAMDLARRIRETLTEPLPVAGIAARLDVSVGVALMPEHTKSALGLLRRADVAMYSAKGDHLGVEVYDASRDEHSRERLVLAGELRDAVATGDLEVHFQPKAEIASGRIVGAEALVRWRHPERGLLFPDAFLPAAEQAGLMRPLTLVVLDRALAACGRWGAAGRALGVAVNLSASNLLDASLPGEVATLLARHGVAPSQLTLEVTEGTILANPLRSGEVLAEIRHLGVAVSLDDFGTGHSSLSHVKRLPVDELKIDRSFVAGLATDTTDRAIVEAIVRLACSLGLNAVAEGVEDDEILTRLREQGCALAQGYLFSRPLPEDDFTAWLDARELTLPRGRRAAARQPS